MKWTNGELVDIYNNAYDNIQLVIDELKDVEEYREIRESLKVVKGELEEKVEPFMQAYNKESEEELEYQNLEYERSKI